MFLFQHLLTIERSIKLPKNESSSEEVVLLFSSVLFTCSINCFDFTGFTGFFSPPQSGGAYCHGNKSFHRVCLFSFFAFHARQKFLPTSSGHLSPFILNPISADFPSTKPSNSSELSAHGLIFQHDEHQSLHSKASSPLSSKRGPPRSIQHRFRRQCWHSGRVDWQRAWRGRRNDADYESLG